MLIAVFVVFAIGILGYLAYQTSIMIQTQQLRAIDSEIDQLNKQYQRLGTRGLVVALQRNANRPGPGIYYVADPTGQAIAGNVLAVPIDVLENPGTHTFKYDRGEDLHADDPRAQGVALVKSFQLPSGFRLVVGRDIVERRGYSAAIFQAFGWGVLWIIALSVIVGVLTARSVLKRVDTVSDTARKIMSGSMSERIPVTKRNDEFDGLATNLNAMLERIEQLMQGLKEVTDNVAHDLKTPLTRLRNKVEGALKDGTTPDQQREALETTIEECDQLIRTFNALLMIARVEAGSPSGAFSPVDLADVITDIAELYEPVAEDSGITISTELAALPRFSCNRELIGQALVNLVENAIKYAKDAKENPAITISLHVAGKNMIIEVADNGAGIPVEDRQRVLERFVRLEKSRSEPGSGLGLSLVAAVARLHKGTIEILDNKPGARIRLSMPTEH
jgi:signal transduction histidine kinase